MVYSDVFLTTEVYFMDIRSLEFVRRESAKELKYEIQSENGDNSKNICRRVIGIMLYHIKSNFKVEANPLKIRKIN